MQKDYFWGDKIFTSVWNFLNFWGENFFMNFLWILLSFTGLLYILDHFKQKKIPNFLSPIHLVYLWISGRSVLLRTSWEVHPHKKWEPLVPNRAVMPVLFTDLRLGAESQKGAIPNLNLKKSKFWSNLKKRNVGVGTSWWRKQNSREKIWKLKKTKKASEKEACYQ